MNPDASMGGIISNVHPFSTGGNSGDIEMNARNLFLSDSASIFSTTLGSGNGGNIHINAEKQITLKDSIGVWIWAGGISTSAIAYGENAVSGDAGNIDLQSGELTIKDGRYIASSSLGMETSRQSGKAGDVNILVSGDVVLSGVNPHGFFSPSGSAIAGNVQGKSGQAGNIFLESHSLMIENGATISASTSGISNGGNVNILVSDSISIKGSSPLKVLNPADLSQYIFLDSFSRIEANSSIPAINSGGSGTISVHAGSIRISDGGMITTSAAGGGKAGEITLDAGRLELDHNASVTSASLSPENGGAAGTITVNTDLVRLSGSSKITTEALNTGSGEATDGKITVTAKDMIYLNAGEITTSVKGGEGKGGDIDISNPEMVVLNNSKIEANAFEGSGGNIRIVSGQFVQSINSAVQASSQKGIDGNINIESPDVNITSGLTVMPGSFIDATKWQQTPCAQRSGASVSRFIFRRKDATPTPLDDWQGIK